MNYYHFLSTLWIQMLNIFMHYLILILLTLYTISYYIFPFHRGGTEVKSLAQGHTARTEAKPRCNPVLSHSKTHCLNQLPTCYPPMFAERMNLRSRSLIY